MSGYLYSERATGLSTRDGEVLPDATVRGLLTYVGRLLETNYLAKAYPENCPDGQGICGTDQSAFWTTVYALIPPIERLHDDRTQPADNDIFDLLEVVGREVAKPWKYHSYFGHAELNFDVDDGQEEYRERVNEFLRRADVMYELTDKMTVERLGPESVQPVLDSLRVSAGDADLDALLTRAREWYVSRKATDRMHALEKLWDAFERLKTLPTGDKKTGVAKLLATFDGPEWRRVVEAEMAALTKLGNDFQIRHFEADKSRIPTDAVDYLFARTGALVTLLLDRLTVV